MTLYALILFIHVTGAFFVFGGMALEWLAVGYLRRDPDRAEMGQWIRLAAAASRFYGPALAVVLFSGGYLASKMGGNQGWILVSFVTLFVIGLIGLLFTSRRLRAIQKAAAGNVTSTALEVRLHDPVLVASVRLRLALVFGVLLLMVSKVDLPLSLITLAGAAALGLTAALPAWRRPPARGAKTLN
jgi:uncharacterized membrane protein